MFKENEERVTHILKLFSKRKYMLDFCSNIFKCLYFQASYLKYIIWRMEKTKDLQPLFCYTLFKIVEGSSSMCTTIHYKTRRFLSLTAFNEPSLALLLLLPFYAFFLPAFIRNIVGVVCCLRALHLV